jgi:hypothetical protein
LHWVRLCGGWGNRKVGEPQRTRRGAKGAFGLGVRRSPHPKKTSGSAEIPAAAAAGFAVLGAGAFPTFLADFHFHRWAGLEMRPSAVETLPFTGIVEVRIRCIHILETPRVSFHILGMQIRMTFPCQLKVSLADFLLRSRGREAQDVVVILHRRRYNLEGER